MQHSYGLFGDAAHSIRHFDFGYTACVSETSRTHGRNNHPIDIGCYMFFWNLVFRCFVGGFASNKLHRSPPVYVLVLLLMAILLARLPCLHSSHKQNRLCCKLLVVKTVVDWNTGSH